MISLSRYMHLCQYVYKWTKCLAYIPCSLQFLQKLYSSGDHCFLILCMNLTDPLHYPMMKNKCNLSAFFLFWTSIFNGFVQWQIFFHSAKPFMSLKVSLIRNAILVDKHNEWVELLSNYSSFPLSFQELRQIYASTESIFSLYALLFMIITCLIC